jgi:hypothetical protein
MTHSIPLIMTGPKQDRARILSFRQSQSLPDFGRLE